MINGSTVNLNFPEFQDTVPTFEALRFYNLGRINSGDVVKATGQTVFNDSLGADFVWDPNSTLVDDNQTAIRPNGYTVGRWIRTNYTAPGSVVNAMGSSTTIAPSQQAVATYVGGIQTGLQTSINTNATNLTNLTTTLGGTGGAGTVGTTSGQTVQQQLNFLNSNINGSVSYFSGFKNLKISTTGIGNYVSTITADTVALNDSSGRTFNANAVAVAPSIGASGLNGLDTGTVAASTWYYVYVIYSSSSTATAGLFSLSATAPTLPNGYSFFARVGAVKTDATANAYLLNMVQNGRRTSYVVAASSNTPALPLITSGSSAGSTATPTWVAVTTNNVIPPTAGRIQILLTINISGSSNSSMIAAPNASYGGAASNTNPCPGHVFTIASSSGSMTQMTEWATETSNIYWATTNTSAIRCMSFEDNL